MKLTTIALITGSFVALLGLLGLVSGEGRLMNEMNIDIVLDVTRLTLGAFLVYAGMKSAELSKTALSIFGGLYLGMFVLGLVSTDLFGLLSSPLGFVDQVIHIGGGIAGFILPFFTNNRNRVAV